MNLLFKFFVLRNQVVNNALQRINLMISLCLIFKGILNLFFECGIKTCNSFFFFFKFAFKFIKTIIFDRTMILKLLLKFVDIAIQTLDSFFFTLKFAFQFTFFGIEVDYLDIFSLDLSFKL